MYGFEWCLLTQSTQPTPPNLANLGTFQFWSPPGDSTCGIGTWCTIGFTLGLLWGTALRDGRHWNLRWHESLDLVDEKKMKDYWYIMNIYTYYWLNQKQLFNVAVLKMMLSCVILSLLQMMDCYTMCFFVISTTSPKLKRRNGVVFVFWRVVVWSKAWRRLREVGRWFIDVARDMACFCW